MPQPKLTEMQPPLTILHPSVYMQGSFLLHIYDLADLLSLVTTLLNAYSQAYILITLIPMMISFIIFTRLSVITADLNLSHTNGNSTIESCTASYTCIQYVNSTRAEQNTRHVHVLHSAIFLPQPSFTLLPFSMHLHAHMYNPHECSPSTTQCQMLPPLHPPPCAPKFSKDSGQEYLQGNLKDNESGSEESTPANLTVHQVGKDPQVDGTDPKEVNKDECLPTRSLRDTT